MNKIKDTLNKIKNFVVKHKIISLVIIVVLISGGVWAYKIFANAGSKTQYVLSAVEKGTIVVSVAGAGQTSSVNELDIKPKTSGDLISVSIVGGQTISKGKLIAIIDPTDAKDSVANAQQALDQAKIDLEKMKGVQTNLGALRGVTEKAQDSLDAAYENGFNTVTNAFLNLPAIMSGLEDILYGNTFNNYQENIDHYAIIYNYNESVLGYKNSVGASYATARATYDNSFAAFKTTSRTSSKDQIESLISKTYDTIGEISQSVKDAINLIQLYQDEFIRHDVTPESISNTHLTSLNGYVNTTNSYLSSLLSIKTNIETNKENLVQTGYDLTNQENVVAEKQKALDSANKNLSYCYIYAPFSGVVSSTNVKVGDSVSTSTALAKIITKDVVANVSLNEVDASKIELGDKVTNTFDAVDNLTLTGVVASIDTMGTVSQGVVSYNVQINFDTQDSRIKPGMSVSSSIITDAKQNVLIAPNSAVKSKSDETYYVLVFDENKEPIQKIVEIGLADDINTEIISGLTEGDEIISRTISTTKTNSAGTSNSTNRATQNLMIGGGMPPTR